jgi:hypothetical protein
MLAKLRVTKLAGRSEHKVQYKTLAGHTRAEFLTGQIRGSELLIFPQASSADLQACRSPLT